MSLEEAYALAIDCDRRAREERRRDQYFVAVYSAEHQPDETVIFDFGVLRVAGHLMGDNNNDDVVMVGAHV